MPAAYLMNFTQFNEYQKTGVVPIGVQKVAVDDDMRPLDKITSIPDVNLSAEQVRFSERAVAASSREDCMSFVDHDQIEQHLQSFSDLVLNMNHGPKSGEVILNELRSRMESVFEVAYSCGVFDALAGRIP